MVNLVLESAALGDQVAETVGDRRIAAPTILEYEVTNVLRRLQADKRLTPAQADAAYGRFRRIPLLLAEFTSISVRVWELRSNITPMDAAYIALAEATDVDLVTTDGRLARAPGIRCRVVVLPRTEP